MTQHLVRNGRIGQLSSLEPRRLAKIVSDAARDPEPWLGLVRYDAASRWYQLLERTEEHEIWLLSWLPGQHTGFHDHGQSAGAFTVTLGWLSERGVHAGRPRPSARRVMSGSVQAFGPGYVHDVRNDGTQPAVSIHAYSPPLSSMRRFEMSSAGQLRVVSEERSW
ncbi:MAG TPA: cysteine dioxygenase family protein [Streptosporangiaceae bacterium]|nr:cysteine dioxygenase family protein [Streptosporangiaceae bacterium]